MSDAGFTWGAHLLLWVFPLLLTLGAVAVHLRSRKREPRG